MAAVQVAAILRPVPEVPADHRGAAARHRKAASSHDRAAKFWLERGDVERAALQRRLAEHERQGAELELQWADLVERAGRKPRRA